MQALRPPLLQRALVPLALILTTGCAGAQTGDGGVAAQVWRPGPPAELLEVLKVVDGDTIHVLRAGETEKLRLLSIDTEEKLSGRAFDPNKPETVFGEETKLWAQEFFAGLTEEGQNPRVGLLFPEGEEARDVYGRLLCHVVLPDGRDYNLVTVQLGKSPYFNKYGNSRLCHEAFVAAQAEARAAGLGVWDPRTNQPAEPGAPAARRDYARLLPWWQCRAEAVDAFRRRRAADPARVASAEEPEALEAALALCADGAERVEVFGAVERLFEEDDGSLTVLFRSPDRQRAFRVRVPAEGRAALAELDLEHVSEPYRQNYLSARGRLVRGPRGIDLWLGEGDSLELAGPPPATPELPQTEDQVAPEHQGA